MVKEGMGDKEIRKFVVKLGRVAKMHYAGYSPDEIAKTLNIPVYTVDRWIKEYVPPKETNEKITESMKCILGC